MRIIFAGTPEFAALHLKKLLLAKEHEVVAVYTQPDRPAGRGKKLSPSAVKVLALENGIDVFQPQSLKTLDAQQQLQSLNADLMVVVAYGLILPSAILQSPKLGCINVHGSILPKWRGAAPIQRSIWAGDKETGVTIMQMDEGLDTGDVLSIYRCSIEPLETSASLYEKLATIGPDALVETINKLDNIEPIKQDNALATSAKKLSKQEAKLDWKLSAAQLERNIRSFNPWPITWFLHNDKTIKVWAGNVVQNGEKNTLSEGEVISYSKDGLLVQTSEACLNITSLQLPGKKPQAISQLINGQASLFEVGDVLA